MKPVTRFAVSSSLPRGVALAGLLLMILIVCSPEAQSQVPGARKTAPVVSTPAGGMRVVTRTPVPCPSPVFPLKGGPKKDRVKKGKGWWMRTEFTLSNSGRFDGTTKIWSSEALRGFTGSVGVILTDCAGNVITRTMGNHQYGVNGTAEGNSSRTEHWTDQVPAAAMPDLSKVGGYYIDHWHDPRSWTERAATTIKRIREIYDAFTSTTPTPSH